MTNCLFAKVMVLMTDEPSPWLLLQSWRSWAKQSSRLRRCTALLTKGRAMSLQRATLREWQRQCQQGKQVRRMELKASAGTARRRWSSSNLCQNGSTTR